MANPNFTILTVEPWTALDRRGNPFEAYRVTFSTKDNDVAYVDLPKATYTPELAKQRVSEEADKLIKTRG